MAFDIAKAAGNAAGGIAQGLGSIFTIGAQKKAAAKQFERQKELQELSKEHQMDIWNRTNYGAQAEHMKAAGLNPALMYGMGGGAGGQTGSVGTGQASQQEVMDVGAAVGQNRLITAQIENIEAQTRKTDVEADKIGGVDTDEAKTRIANLTQGIQNQKAQEALTRVQTSLAEIDEKFQNKTFDERADYIMWLTRTAEKQFGIADAEEYVSQNTKEAKIQLVQRELINASLTSLIMEAQQKNIEGATKLDKAKINEIAERIEQQWTQIDQEDERIGISKDQLKVDKFKAEFQANYPSISQTGGKIIDDTISMITELPNKIFGGYRSRKQWKGIK